MQSNPGGKQIWHDIHLEFCHTEIQAPVVQSIRELKEYTAWVFHNMRQSEFTVCIS